MEIENNPNIDNNTTIASINQPNQGLSKEATLIKKIANKGNS